MPDNTNTSKNSKLKNQLVSSTLSKLAKNDLVNRDIFGRTILHVLILSNRFDLLRSLLKNPEVKILLSLTDYENGWNCMHYAIFHKRLSCYKVLIDHLRNIQNGNSMTLNNNHLLELLRAKDRNKMTPLQLLDNDFKDLIWVPEYIDENNEYHLRYRYQHNTKDSDFEEENRSIPRKLKIVAPPNNWSNLTRGGSDLYMFGSNKNNNLGVGDATDRAIPSKISDKYFKVENTDIKSMQSRLLRPRYKLIEISKNHSIVLTQDGNLHSCGIGSRGRLGHGFNNLNNSFRFKKIEFFDLNEDENNGSENKQIIRDVAISSNHSIALNTHNEVYSWGLNNYNQLGYSSSIASSSNSMSQKSFLEPFEGLPKKIVSGDLRKNLNEIKGITVSKIHSVAFTKNELFFWGLCIGQMGLSMDTTVPVVEHKVNNMPYKGFVQRSPKKVSLRDEIKCVLTSETCTCVITTTNDIHIYYQYQHFKLPKIPVKGSTDKHFDFFKPTKLTQATTIEKVSLRSHHFIALLLDNGDVMSFTLNQSEADESSSKNFRTLKYTSLWKSYDRDMKVVDMNVSNDGSIILCTRNGSAFIKTHSLSRKSSMTDATLSIPTVKNKFKRIENLNKVVKVACDDNFLSFGFIRDDIDLVPLKLHTNDFFKDMEYLSCLSNVNFSRKQTQLLASNFNDNYYISDYLYPNKPKKSGNNVSSYHSILQGPSESEEEIEEYQEGDYIEKNKKRTHDILYERHVRRYDFQRNRKNSVLKTFLLSSRMEDESLMNLLKSDTSYIFHKLIENSDSNKKYNCLIKFETFPDISIKIHKELFILRSPFCAKIFNHSNPGDYFIEEGIKGKYNPDKNELIFNSNINIKSMLIMSHFIYTNKVLKVWDDFPGGLSCPKDIKDIKQDFDKLARLFLVTDIWGKFSTNDVFLKKVSALIDNKDSDVVIRLKDGEMSCHSYILIARSAFFETVLSERWNYDSDCHSFKVLTLEDISMFQFKIILRHLYGYNDVELFDCLTTSDIDEFINCLLELIEISDELLLFHLKDLCQLGVKDFISLENVLILLTHAHNLDASKLFMSCCWFIYNNLESILLDPLFKDIQDDLLKKLEKQVIFFQHCKLIDFDFKREKKSDYSSLLCWMERESNSLIKNFLSNMQNYNESFISDERGFEGFEPLIDVKYDLRKSTQESFKKKKDSMSQSANPRKSSAISDTQKVLIDLRKIAASKYNENENALEDSEDGFEVVNNRRRQNSKGDSIRPVLVFNSASPTPPPSQSLSRSSSVVDALNVASANKSPFNPLNSSKASQVNRDLQCSSGLSPHSNWASKSKGILIIPPDKQPILGKGYENNSDSQNHTLQKTKIKFGPTVRLSQKERKKLASQILPHINNNVGDSKAPRAWTQPNSKSSSINSANASEKSNLPLLGKSKYENVLNQCQPQLKASVSSSLSTRYCTTKSENVSNSKIKSRPPSLAAEVQKHDQVSQGLKDANPAYSAVTFNVNKPVNKVYSTPSLAEIMIHESLKSEEAKIKQTEKKSLQEIQQEQQFAKWWEEEAARVQQQMSQMDIVELSLSNPNKKRSNSASKSKKYKGNRSKSPSKNYSNGTTNQVTTKPKITNSSK